MRIIAGRAGGRTFDSPGTHRTHPMSDKMRGALFNILGDINGLTVFDPFGGSGALSFEAASRGASRITVLDSDRAAQQTIAQNIRKLELQKVVVLAKAAAGPWLATNASAQFDIVLCDPPYDDLQLNLLKRLAKTVRSGGIMALSYPSNLPAPALENLTLVKQQTYGDASLLFYRPSLKPAPDAAARDLSEE